MKNEVYLIPDKNTLSSLCSLIRDYCSTKTLVVHRQHPDPLWIADCPLCGDFCVRAPSHQLVSEHWFVLPCLQLSFLAILLLFIQSGLFSRCVFAQTSLWRFCFGELCEDQTG
jgi:hypothetical protein